MTPMMFRLSQPRAGCDRPKAEVFVAIAAAHLPAAAMSAFRRLAPRPGSPVTLCGRVLGHWPAGKRVETWEALPGGLLPSCPLRAEERLARDARDYWAAAVAALARGAVASAPRIMGGVHGAREDGHAERDDGGEENGRRG